MGYPARKLENVGGGGKRPCMRTLVRDCGPYFLLSSQAVDPGLMPVLIKFIFEKILEQSIRRRGNLTYLIGSMAYIEHMGGMRNSYRTYVV